MLTLAVPTLPSLRSLLDPSINIATETGNSEAVCSQVGNFWTLQRPLHVPMLSNRVKVGSDPLL